MSFPYNYAILVLACTVGVRTGRREKDCYSTEPTPFRRYSTKTAYEDVRGINIQEETVSGCKPIIIHLVARHGSRYPGPGDRNIDYSVLQSLQREILANWKQGRLCERDVRAISNWTRRMLPKDRRRICQTGRLEAFLTSRRFKQRFPQLLRRPYHKNVYKFIHTDEGRNNESAFMFARALFKSSDRVRFEIDSHTDPILPYFKNCEKYEKLVRIRLTEDYKKFRYGRELNWTVSDIVSRFGLQNSNVHIDIDVVYTLYEICRFEHAIYGDSPWCAAFQLENLKHLEYHEDMKYAGTIIKELACPLARDVLKTFEEARKGSPVRGAFRFGHTPNLSAYLVLLGLITDSKVLKVDNYHEMANRRWITSKYIPMNANVAFTLYQCDDKQYRVKAFVNEHAVVLPGCDSTVCLYDTVKTLLNKGGSRCRLDEICRH